MIDIHSHAIFDVDNGSRSLEQSIKMIKMAKSVGFEAICFTPHYNNESNVLTRKELLEKILKIKNELTKNKINMHLYLGEEVSIFPNMPDKMHNVISLNDTRYVLLTFTKDDEITYLEELVDSMVSMGKVPILAYPERYERFRTNKQELIKLVKRGALLQVNANSLTGQYGEEVESFTKELLEKDLVSFVASDAHSVAGYYKARKGFDILKNLVGEDKFKLLTKTNPCRALADIKIDMNERAKKEHLNRDKMIVKFFKTFPILERML